MNVGYVVKSRVLGENGNMCSRSYGCVSGLLGMYMYLSAVKFARSKVPSINRVPPLKQFKNRGKLRVRFTEFLKGAPFIQVFLY